jgi:hypothetical protein
MSDSSAINYRNLIAKLADAALSEEEATQLRAILKNDKISQEMYLDHMFVHALLENEFGAISIAGESPANFQSAPLINKIVTGSRASASGDISVASKHKSAFSQASSLLASRAVLGSLAALVLLGFVANMVIVNRSGTSNGEDKLPLMIANSSFETHTSVPRSAKRLDTWFGDHAVTVEDWSDIQPVDGHKMLRFVKSMFHPVNACEVYQVIDLASYPNYSEDDVSIVASAFFNAKQDDLSGEASRFSVAMFAMAEEPGSFAEEWQQGTAPALAYAGQLEEADRDVSSWQQVESRIDLPEGARFLVVQLSVIDGTINDVERTREHFVDSVAVNMVSGK